MLRHDEVRRAILATLAVASDVMTLRELRESLELVHGAIVSLDAVHCDLLWLDEMGLVKYRMDGAALVTSRGIDVALRRAPWPGRG